MRRWLVAAAGVIAVMLGAGWALLSPGPASQHPGIGLVQVSADPYTDSSAEHATEAEPDTVAAGHSVMSVFQAGRWRHGGADNIGWALSSDDGHSWRHGFLPGLTRSSQPPGPFTRASDPVAAYNAAAKEWMASALDLESTANGKGVAVSVSVSSDGLHWGKPVIVARITKTGEEFDKEWITCDNTPASPFYGRCYAEWDVVTQGALVVMSTSRDGGRTWSAPIATRSHLDGEAGEPVVQPDGTVVVAVLGIFGPDAMLADFRSTDGGRTWGPTVKITYLFGHTSTGNLRSPGFHSVTADHFGRIYVSWPDCRFRPHCASNDMVMTTSADGLHWTPVTRIPIDPVTSTVDHLGGGLGADPASGGSRARLGLFYYFYPRARCTDAACRLYVGYVSSADGGAHWSAPRAVAGPMPLAQLALAYKQRMVGDYQGAAVAPGGRAFSAFPVGRASSGTASFSEAMDEPRDGEPVTGGPRPASPAGAHKPKTAPPFDDDSEDG